MSRTLVAVAAILVLAAATGLAQSTPPAAALPQATTARLDSLKPLIDRLQRLVQSDDVDGAFDTSEKIRTAIANIYFSLHSPSKNLELMENVLMAHPEFRSSRIGVLAMFAATAGDFGKARSYAIEALSNTGKGQNGEPQNNYYGNYVLGLVALNAGDVTAAKQYLLASTKAGGWASLAYIGPNVSLAKALLVRGEREVVVEYLEKCKTLWPKGGKTIDLWLAVIRAGATPDFGPHLVVTP